MRNRRRRRPGRRGAVAVVVALCLFPMIGVMALAIDAGLLMAERRRAQAAADAASFAAVCTYHKVAQAGVGRDPMAAARAAALSYAAANGFSNDGVSSTVTAGAAGTKPARYTLADPAVEVVVTSHQRRLFSAIWGADDVDAVGRATSVRIVDAAADPSIIVLNPRDQASLSVAGSGRVIAEGEIQVKSNNSRSVDVNNAGYIKAPTLKMAGNFQTSSGGTIDSSTVKKTGADASAIVDTQESLARPDPAGQPSRTSPSGWNPQKPYPIYPGVYNNGLTLNSGGMAYTMNPGVYYIKQGDFTVSNGVPVRGEGVVIYLDNGNINIQGGYGGYFGDPNTVYLTPPTTGPYKGVSFFQRSDKNPSTGDYTPRSVNMANGTYNKIDGLIYAPGATAAIAGGSTNSYGRQLIVNKLNVSNNALVNVPKPASTSSNQSHFYLAK